MPVDEFDPLTLDPSQFPRSGAFEDQLRWLVSYATRAPSGHNAQPWLFRLECDTIDVIADRRRALPVVDPHDRELTISCGAAVAYLEVAARHFGYAIDTKLSPEPNDKDVLARLKIQPGATPNQLDKFLFEAIPKRRTNRSSYAAKLPPNEVLSRCSEIAGKFGIELTVVGNEAQKASIAELVAEGDRIQFDDVRFRRELASWVHSTRLGSRDGMSGAGFGMPDALAPVARFVIRTFDLGEGVAATDEKKIVEGSPMLTVFCSSGDSTNDWLQTGRALAYVLLNLSGNGIASSYLNQPIEVDILRPKLRSILATTDIPQILIRVGYAQIEAAQSSRRSLSEVITRS